MTYKILAEVVDITANDAAKTMPSLFVGSIYRVFPNGERQHVISGPAANDENTAYNHLGQHLAKFLSDGVDLESSLPSMSEAA